MMITAIRSVVVNAGVSASAAVTGVEVALWDIYASCGTFAPRAEDRDAFIQETFTASTTVLADGTAVDC